MMDNIDIIATIDMIFDHLSSNANETSIKEARRAIKMIALHAYTDTGSVVSSLMPKEML